MKHPIDSGPERGPLDALPNSSSAESKRARQDKLSTLSPGSSLDWDDSNRLDQRPPQCQKPSVRQTVTEPTRNSILLAGTLPGDWSGTPASRPEVAEKRVAGAICRLLDQGLQELPSPVTVRLATARARALDRLADSAATQVVAPTRRSPVSDAGTSLSWRWRLGAVTASLAVVALGFAWIDSMEREQSVINQVEVDAELLADDLPLNAYADRGFGVYLVNTRSPTAIPLQQPTPIPLQQPTAVPLQQPTAVPVSLGSGR